MGRNSSTNRSNMGIRKNARELENCNYTPIHKKGDKMQCSTHRGISLLNVCCKVFTNILSRWLVPYAEEILRDYKCCFTKGRSTTDNLLMFRSILEKNYELRLDFHLLLSDFKQVYDSINIKHLYET